MRRYIYYLSVALLAFGIGLFFVFKFYLKTDTSKDSSANYINTVNEWIDEIESRNVGFDELIKAKNGDFVKVRGLIDEKFLCLDVTDSQQNICTTVLTGNSSEKKSLLIRLWVCSEQNNSNCIVWKPKNLCPDNVLCSNRIKIYDDNSKATELVEYLEDSKSYYHKSIQLKVTGKVSTVDGKARLSTPIEQLEIIEME